MNVPVPGSLSALTPLESRTPALLQLKEALLPHILLRDMFLQIRHFTT